MLIVLFYLSTGMKPIAEDDRRLLVKQSYPYKTKGEQECEAVRRKYALKETSRIMTSEGTVIKMMEDGNIEVCNEFYNSLLINSLFFENS